MLPRLFKGIVLLFMVFSCFEGLAFSQVFIPPTARQCANQVFDHNFLVQKATRIVEPYVDQLLRELYSFYALEMSPAVKKGLKQYVSAYDELVEETQGKSGKNSAVKSRADLELNRKNLYSALTGVFSQKDALAREKNRFSFGAEPIDFWSNVIVGKRKAVIERCVSVGTTVSPTWLQACASFDLISKKTTGYPFVGALNHPVAVLSGYFDDNDSGEYQLQADAPFSASALIHFEAYAPHLQGFSGYSRDLQASYASIKSNCSSFPAFSGAIPALSRGDIKGEEQKELEHEHSREAINEPDVIQSNQNAASPGSTMTDACVDQVFTHNSMMKKAQYLVEPYTSQLLGGLYSFFAFHLSPLVREQVAKYVSIYDQLAAQEGQAAGSSKASPSKTDLEEARKSLHASLSQALAAMNKSDVKAWDTHPRSLQGDDSLPFLWSNVIVGKRKVILERCLSLGSSLFGEQDWLQACVSFDLVSRQSKGYSTLEALNHPAAILRRNAKIVYNPKVSDRPIFAKQEGHSDEVRAFYLRDSYQRLKTQACAHHPALQAAMPVLSEADLNPEEAKMRDAGFFDEPDVVMAQHK